MCTQSRRHLQVTKLLSIAVRVICNGVLHSSSIGTNVGESYEEVSSSECIEVVGGVSLNLIILPYLIFFSKVNNCLDKLSSLDL